MPSCGLERLAIATMVQPPSTLSLAKSGSSTLRACTAAVLPEASGSRWLRLRDSHARVTVGSHPHPVCAPFIQASRYAGNVVAICWADELLSSLHHG